MTQRTDRVDELLRQEIGQLLARDVADPRIGFATITDVETTPDLRHAKVWVSVIGTEAERKAAVGALAHAMPFIRHELGVRLRIKRIPELHVRLDDTSERGTRILRLINELEDGANVDDGGAAAEAGGTCTPASASHSASTVPTGTASPCGTRIFTRRPASGASISFATLSFSTISQIAPRAKRAPSASGHSVTVPSVMVSPSLGIRIWRGTGIFSSP